MSIRLYKWVLVFLLADTPQKNKNAFTSIFHKTRLPTGTLIKVYFTTKRAEQQVIFEYDALMQYDNQRKDDLSRS